MSRAISRKFLFSKYSRRQRRVIFHRYVSRKNETLLFSCSITDFSSLACPDTSSTLALSSSVDALASSAEAAFSCEIPDKSLTASRTLILLLSTISTNSVILLTAPAASAIFSSTCSKLRFTIFRALVSLFTASWIWPAIFVHSSVLVVTSSIID